MIKKIILVALIALGSTISYADSLSLTDSVKSLPAWKEGFMYEWNQNRIVHLSTIELANYKGFSLEA